MRDFKKMTKAEKLAFVTHSNEMETCVNGGNECDHVYRYDCDTDYHDDSFDHAFGTQKCGHVECEVHNVFMVRLGKDKKPVAARFIPNEGLGEKVYAKIAEYEEENWEPEEREFDKDACYERKYGKED